MADINQTLVSRGQQGAPILDLNFSGSSFGIEGVGHPTLLSVPGLAFSRASVGYAVVGASGLLVKFGTGIPRVTDQGILIEEARTNLLLHSQDMETGWANEGNNTVVNAGGTAPDNTATSRALVEGNTTVGSHDARQSFTVAANTTYTASIFVLFNARPRIAITEIVSGAAAFFDITTGSVVSNTGISARISGVFGGYRRIELTFKTGASQTSANIAFTAALSDSTYLYAGTVGLTAFYLWGAQCEAGVSASSYIVTTTAAATRTADGLTSTATVQNSTVIAKIINPSVFDTSRNYPIVGITNGYPIAVSSSSIPFTYTDADGSLQVAAVATPGAVASYASGSTQAGGRHIASAGASYAVDAHAFAAPLSIQIGTINSVYWLNSYLQRLTILPYALSKQELIARTQ